MRSAEEKILNAGFEDIIILKNFSYDTALVGISDDRRAIYDFNKMVQWLMHVEDFDEIEAIEWIDHQLIHPTLGSLVHPGEILINLPVVADTTTRGYREDNEKITKEYATGCTDCNLCLEACPTGALRNNVWDASQCIAYTTHHCLECQTICPFNNPS